MKIALVHDQLKDFGGAERVLIALKRVYSDAPIFTAFVDRKRLKHFARESESWNIHTSWFGKIPFLSKLYSPLRFLAPFLWESFDLSPYDTIISSSGWYMSKGIITRPETMHISYIHHQPKFLYYYDTSMNWQKYWPIRIYGHFINHFLRMWDYISSQRPDILVANAEETRRRIAKYYRRDSVVIYPPVHIPDAFDSEILSKKKAYYVTTSRLVSTKNIDLLIKAANKYGFNLKVIGKGPLAEDLQKLAGPTVEIIGFLPDRDFQSLFHHAKAFLNAAVDEEFGIAPVEAMSYGVPVLAYASGGLKETIIDGKNGYLYHELSVKAIGETVKKFESLSSSDDKSMRLRARQESEKYSEQEFAVKIKALVEKS